uniref:PiggyBac transposable element-derived protein domain-containing protein n=1 Tax=Hippocampus comes TaxID=109280 RepID=A0A3Q2Y1F9_HIPCM
WSGLICQWKKKPTAVPQTDFFGAEIITKPASLLTPLAYFKRFVTDDMIEALTRNTNKYSLQKSGTSVTANILEIQRMLGIFLKMDLVQMPGIPLVMSLHFVNNWTVPEMEKRDKLWKLRPWLDSFRERCMQVIPEEHNSVDEMVIPFKGRFIKQYMRYKPRPWGFKLWVRTGISDILCDFDVYQGGVDGRRVRSELGLPGDRYAYPTEALMSEWKGTTKWYDNRAVTLVSSFARPDPVQKIQRWDKATRTTVKVERPYIVGCYNKYMGGVDLLDSFAAKYKFPMKSQDHHLQWLTPPMDVRQDMVAHFPGKTERGRCRHCGQRYTAMLCSKCKVHLCFTEAKNCFVDYHSK